MNHASPTLPATQAPSRNIIQLAAEAAASKGQLLRENQVLKDENARLKAGAATPAAAAPMATPAAVAPASGHHVASPAAPSVSVPPGGERAALEDALAAEKNPRRRFEIAAQLNQAGDPLPAMSRAEIEAELAVEKDPRRRFQLASALN
jgi:hypothetical protein